MPKRRLLTPESVYARHNLEQWLSDEIGVSLAEQHRRRIWKALPCASLEDMRRRVPDLPNVVYEKFHEKFVLTTSRVVEEKASEHGAKLVIETQDGHLIETVLIQHHKGDGRRVPGRTTVCVSSQVGCQMACTFCATGTMGRLANLTAAEIVEQVHHARLRYPDCSNVVFMGMGEPLDNYENVKEAIFSLQEPYAFAIPLSRITLSTVGVTHAIHRLARECPEIQLALSLHAPNDEIRTQIVPTTRAFSVKKIMDAVAVYQNHNKRSVMIEYIMIADVNSSPECAHELGKLLEGRNCMVNLIPYNPTEAGDRFDYRSPPNATIETFQNIIFRYKSNENKPIRCSVRWSSARGQEIDAACGQLALKNLNSSNGGNSSGSGGNINRSATVGDDCEKLGKHAAAVTPQDIEDLGQGSGCGARRLTRKAAPDRSSGKSQDADTVSFLSEFRVHRHWYIVCVAGVALASSALVLRRKR